MTKREEMLVRLEASLKEAGFKVSNKHTERSYCFDLACRRGRQLAFIKVPNNIQNVSINTVAELREISDFFSAASLFICNKTRNKQLEDDTVYKRYNICTITLKTFEDVILRKMRPLIEAGRGGYYVGIDGDALRNKRQEHEFSIGRLAEMVGVSRRTLYGYEKGMAKASVQNAYNLEWAVGASLAKPIDVFEKEDSKGSFLTIAKRMIIKNRFLKRVLRQLSNLTKQRKCRVVTTKRAPFDFLAQILERRLIILGGVVDKNKQNIDERMREIISVSRVTGAKPVFIAEGVQIPECGIPLIQHDELEKMRCIEDLISRI